MRHVLHDGVHSVKLLTGAEVVAGRVHALVAHALLDAVAGFIVLGRCGDIARPHRVARVRHHELAGVNRRNPAGIENPDLRPEFRAGTLTIAATQCAHVAQVR